MLERSSVIDPRASVLVPVGGNKLVVVAQHAWRHEVARRELVGHAADLHCLWPHHGTSQGFGVGDAYSRGRVRLE